MTYSLRMAGRIQKASGIVGNKLTNFLIFKRGVKKDTGIENVNEIKGLDDDISTTCQATIERLIDRIDSLTVVVKKLSRESAAMREALSPVRSSSMPWESKESSALQRIFFLEWKLEALEKGLNRNDIVISGLDVGKANIRESVRDFLEEWFQKDVYVETARLVRKNKPTVIRATLGCSETRDRILAGREKLKGTNLYVNSVETTYDRDVRQQLKYIAAREAEKGKKVIVGYRRLTVDGKQYIWKHGIGLQKKSDVINDLTKTCNY